MRAIRWLALLLALCMLLVLTGCDDSAAATLGAALVEGMRGQTLQFSFVLQFQRDSDHNKALRGSGAATGLFGETPLLAASGEVEHHEKYTVTRDYGGRRISSPGHRTYYTDYMQAFYRGGALYLADGVREGFTMPPSSLVRVELSEALRAGLAGGGLDAATLGEVGVSAFGGGRRLRCEIAPGSELGGAIGAVFVALDDGTFGSSTAFDTGYRAELTTDPVGRLAQLDLTVSRSTLSRDYEITLSVFADGYSDDAEPPAMPDYVK